MTICIRDGKQIMEDDADMNELNLPWLPKHEASDKHLSSEVRLKLGNVEIGLITVTGSAIGKDFETNTNIEAEGKDYRAGILYLKIGSFLNDAMKAGLQGAVVGGIAGIATSQVVSNAISVGGFLGGAITGAAGGASGGFVGGSMGAWLNGASLGEGLLAGLKGAGMGDYYL